MTSSLGQNVSSVLLKKCDSLAVPDSNGMDELGLRESMLFAEPIRLAGEDFIARAFGGSKYVAVHCRRTDFLKAHTKTTPDQQAIAAQINTLLKDQGAEHVFVATDAPDELR